MFLRVSTFCLSWLYTDFHVLNGLWRYKALVRTISGIIIEPELTSNWSKATALLEQLEYNPLIEKPFYPTMTELNAILCNLQKSGTHKNILSLSKLMLCQQTYTRPMVAFLSVCLLRIKDPLL